MKRIATDHRINLWSELLPLTILSGLVFYLALAWSPIIILLVLLPVVLGAFLLGTSQLWWIVIGLVPLSMNTEQFIESSVSMYLPTEPLFLGFLVLSLLFFIKYPIEKRFLNHPISRMVILYFGWMFVTVIVSSVSMVSLKSFTAQMWYVIPVFYLGSRMLLKHENRSRFLNAYLIGFTIVIIFTLVKLWSHGFPEKESQWLMQPFFKDHTILGAVLGLVLPYIYLKGFSRIVHQKKRTVWIILSILCTIVLIYTFSRAALVSLVVAGVFYLFIQMKIQFKYLLGTGVLLLAVILWNQEVLINKLSSNQAESSGEVVENIESISNISSDASNLERINRWNSAIGMWKEKPLFGWGPGTYQFVYAPFQKSSDLTIISTNEGDVGNAHSEYLGTLAESGLPSFILLVILILVIIGTGYNRVLLLAGKDKLLLLAVLLGLIAYFTHGVLNNFMNSDKVSVLIWGFAAIIIHYDLD